MTYGAACLNRRTCPITFQKRQARLAGFFGAFDHKAINGVLDGCQRSTRVNDARDHQFNDRRVQTVAQRLPFYQHSAMRGTRR